MNNKQRWKWMEQELKQLKERSQYRKLYSTKLLANGWLEREGRRMLNLASNDYLGLSQPNPGDLLECAQTGAAASRLIVGSDPVYDRFERAFAKYKGTEASLVFSSGYMANLGIIASLVGRNDIVLSDRLNHASIIDGITLSRAEHQRYRHRNLEHLEHLLQKTKSSQKKLIITDAIFSMDGDAAPIEELVTLKNKYHAILMVDEAHSSGVFGTQGKGLVHSLGLTEQVDIHMGTFSKAYGCYGAYAAGDQILIDYLVNKARSFIFTTALPPMNIIAIEQQWEKVVAGDGRRNKLFALSQHFRNELHNFGFSMGRSESQIIPLMVGENELAVEFSRRLQAEGIAAVAIRPPTVPQGTARIRFTLMSSHQLEDIDQALEVIGRTGKELKII